MRELDRRANLNSKKVKILLTGYYDPFTLDNADCVDYKVTTPTGTITLLDQTETGWLTGKFNLLNDNIDAEVAYAKANFTHIKTDVVDMRTVMAGHEFCSSDPWVYGPSIAYPFRDGTFLDNPNPSP